MKNYQIEMLGVGAADAFIIYYVDDDDSRHLILVDGGNYDDGAKIISHIRHYYPSNVDVELAIVTHPDDDHYGGFVYMIERLRDGRSDAVKINEFWLDDPGNGHVDKDEIKWKNKQDVVNVKARSVFNLNGDESKNLLVLIDSLGIARSETFAVSDAQTFKKYFTIIGPTKEYYEELLPNFRNDELHLKTDESEEEKRYSEESDNYDGDILSKTLDDAPDDASAHNKSSLIIMFEPTEGNKFLFMGDASYESFQRIPQDLKDRIKNVSWLKVPHHGSKHNLNTEMIKHIKPGVAYVSTEKIGKYLNQCTVNALKKVGTAVYSTKNTSNLAYNLFDGRSGYSPAIPL